MTIQELEELRNRAAKQTGDAIRVSVGSRGWSLISDGPLANMEDKLLSEIVERLAKWATPPRPETVTITVPFAWAAKRCHQFDSTILDAHEATEVERACFDAIKPYVSQR